MLIGIATFCRIYSITTVDEIMYKTKPYREYEYVLDWQMPDLRFWELPHEIKNGFSFRVYLMNETGSLFAVWLFNRNTSKIVGEVYNVTFDKPAIIWARGSGKYYVAEIRAYKKYPLEFERHLYPSYKVKVVIFSYDLEREVIEYKYNIMYPLERWASFFNALAVVSAIISITQILSYLDKSKHKNKHPQFWVMLRCFL